MIVGVGAEWVDVPRFAAALDRFGDRLRDRLFTADERAEARSAESLAVRFAAKVAARRALRATGLGWHAIEVSRAPRSAPVLRLSGAARRHADRLGVVRVTLTLSHDARCGVGQVLLESAD